MQLIRNTGMEHVKGPSCEGKQKELSDLLVTYAPCELYPDSELRNLKWRMENPSYPTVMWSNRERSVELLSFGSAFTLHSHAEAKEFRRRNPKALIFAACAFDSGRKQGSEWEQFPASLFLCPEAGLLRINGVTRYFAQVHQRGNHKAAEKNAQALMQTLQQSLSRTTVIPTLKLRQVRSILPKHEWQSLVREVLKLFAKNTAEKIVLARRYDLSPVEYNPYELLCALDYHDMRKGDSRYSLLFQPSESAWFLSRTAEKLFSIHHTTFTSESLGGTLWGKQTVNKKLLFEQEIIMREVLKELDPFVENTQVISQNETINLGNISHLRSRIAGSLRHAVSPLEIMGALHPTPAVCGFPKLFAKEKIREEEGFDRGWYAGTIGILTEDFTEFAVSIRCLLKSDTNLYGYAGCGLVQGSDPEVEYEELDRKLNSFLHGVLGE